MADAVLTFNAGSSSIKFSLFELSSPDRLSLAFKGEVEGIDSAPHFFVHDATGNVLTERRWTGSQPDFQALLETVI
ncbi:MAG TPA: acetate kinase, partial [Methylovirgula sp.]